MRLKSPANREVSERRQVGDAIETVNAPERGDVYGEGHGGRNRVAGGPWWRNVGMDDAL